MAEIVFILQEEANLRRERVYLDKNNPLECMDDKTLIKKFRFPKSEIVKLIHLCSPTLKRKTNRSHALPVHMQVLGALRFYAKATFQDDGGELVGMSQSSMSHSIHGVTEVLCNNASSYIHFPQTEADIRKLKQGFYQLTGKPNIIGLIDGTQVPIRGPSGPDEPLYIGRKTGLGHTLNVQVICDSNKRFIDIVAKWPGATHDSFIWKCCALRNSFVENPPSGILIGDSGYGVEPWLFTPLEDPKTKRDKDFNRFLRSIRSLVERAIGLWKSRFRRIDRTGGRMLYNPVKSCKIIVATAVLHNIRRELNLQEDEDLDVEESVNPHADRHRSLDDNSITRAGNAARRLYIQTHFN